MNTALGNTQQIAADAIASRLPEALTSIAPSNDVVAIGLTHYEITPTYTLPFEVYLCTRENRTRIISESGRDYVRTNPWNILEYDLAVDDETYEKYLASPWEELSQAVTLLKPGEY